MRPREREPCSVGAPLAIALPRRIRTLEHIDRLQESGRAEILTVNGRAEVVVQSAEAYQELLDVVDRAESVLGVHRGLLDVQEDRGADLEEVLKEVRSERLEDRDIPRILHHLESEFPASSAAEQWLDQLERRLETLREFPHRCPRAPEDEAFPQMIRQLLVDPYRVLFTVYEEQVWIRTSSTRTALLPRL